MKTLRVQVNLLVRCEDESDEQAVRESVVDALEEAIDNDEIEYTVDELDEEDEDIF